MTNAGGAVESDGEGLIFGGAILGSLTLGWMMIGWFANGYPDGFLLLLTSGSAIACFIGIAQRKIHRAKAAEKTPADDL